MMRMEEEEEENKNCHPYRFIESFFHSEFIPVIMIIFSFLS
jgi:hypothetical protein